MIPIFQNSNIPIGGEAPNLSRRIFALLGKVANMQKYFDLAYGKEVIGHNQGNFSKKDP